MSTTAQTYSRRLLTLGLAGGITMMVLAACGGSKPQTAATPQPNADSAAAAEQARQAEAERQAREDAERKAREEAERQAREEAERVARQHTADSLAAVARAADELRTTLATMIHFDFDKSKVLPGDGSVLDQKVTILTANPDVKIRIAGHCDERGSAEYNIALGNRRAAAA